MVNQSHDLKIFFLPKQGKEKAEIINNGLVQIRDKTPTCVNKETNGAHTHKFVLSTSEAKYSFTSIKDLGDSFPLICE